MQLPKKKDLTKENILELIDEYDILKAYYPADRKLEFNKASFSPFRNEKQESFIVGDKYGVITYKDMGDSYFRGDIWKFVKQIKGLSNYNDVLVDIDKTFKLGFTTGNLIKKGSIITPDKPKLQPKVSYFIQASVSSRSFEGEKYLESYHLTLKDMNIFKDTKVRFAKELLINKRTQSIGDFCLIYNLKNERGDWIKAYRPNGPKSTKWRTNIPFTEMHGIDEIQGCDTVIVTKSLKDASIITKFTGLCTTVIQAEDIAAISEENMEKLKAIPNLYIALDIDTKGVSTSWELTTLLNCKHVNAPYSLLDLEGTDFADMVQLTGYQSVIEHFKNKNII